MEMNASSRLVWIDRVLFDVLGEFDISFCIAFVFPWKKEKKDFLVLHILFLMLNHTRLECIIIN